MQREMKKIKKAYITLVQAHLVPTIDRHTITPHFFRRCRFGGVVVLATRLSPSEIQCYAPPLEARTYSLELSLNNQDYTDRRFPFLYFDDQVTSMVIGGDCFFLPGSFFGF